MQIYPILLIGIVLMADGGLGLGSGAAPGGWRALAVAVVPVAVILAAAWAGVGACARRLSRRPDPAAVIAADRLARTARWLLIAHFAAAVLLLGWLDAVRAAVGDLVVIDEVLAMGPTLLGLAGTWWIYYPVERRVREAVLIRRLDSGQAIFPTPSRGRYVATQVRMHLLFLLVPIVLIGGCAELIGTIVGRLDGAWWAVGAGNAATLAAAGAVVLLAPLLARLVLEVERFPDGPLRDDLLAVCSRHRVTVGRLLVWNTHGSMINAAVMGLIGPLRYVLLTDALLESMTGRQIEAVMAHEIGHVRRHHLPWLLVTLVAGIMAVAMPVLEAGFRLAPASFELGSTAAVLVAALGVFTVFGWVSRRFERQADSFAVRHLNGGGGWGAAGGAPRPISAEAVAVVSGALETIARLNAMTPHRRSWRHGSIAWRQAYLRSIVGRAEDRLPIDRQVRWIKAVSAVVVAAGMGWVMAGIV